MQEYLSCSLLIISKIKHHLVSNSGSSKEGMVVHLSFFVCLFSRQHPVSMPGSLIIHSFTIHWTSIWQAQNLLCEVKEFYPNEQRQMWANNYKVIRHILVCTTCNEHTEDEDSGSDWDDWGCYSRGKKKVTLSLTEKSRTLSFIPFLRLRCNWHIINCMSKMYKCIYKCICVWVYRYQFINPPYLR